jgi:membrane protein YdbS with pleckstrin-like domain
MSGGEIKFSVRPVFVGWITLLMALPFQIFLAIWSGGFVGVMAANLTGTRWSWPPVLLVGGAVFVALPISVYIVKKLNYARTEYRFYADQIEFEEGFFTVSKKIVKFENVKEVTLRKGIFQQLYGLGTIYLSTVATGVDAPASPFGSFGFGNVSASGVSARDIPNADDTYDAIKNLVDARSA